MVKKGYKQTEIGVIPVDWDIITYGEAFNFLSTATYSRSQLSENENIKYIHYGDIHTKFNHYLDLNKKLPSISEELSKNYSLIEDGDIIMADASEDFEGVGKSVEVINSENNKAISGLHTFLFRDKSNNFQNGYKAYISESKLVKNSFSRLATGMKVYGVSKTNLKTILIPKPTQTEQVKIATTLTDIDNLIKNLQTLKNKKIAIKQGAMQQLLTGKKRLKGFTEDWETKKLGEVIDLVVDNRGKTPPLKKEGFPLIEVNSIYKQGKSPNFNLVTKFVDKSTYENWFRDGHPLVNDILVVTVGSAGVTSYFNSQIGCIAQNIIALRLNKSQDAEFYYYLTKTRLFKDKVKEVLMGGVQPSLKVPHIKKFDFDVPKDLIEQQAISKILSDMDKEIEALEQQKRKTEELKKGMMQQLLTGKIRLINSFKENEKPLAMVAESKLTYTKED